MCSSPRPPSQRRMRARLLPPAGTYFRLSAAAGLPIPYPGRVDLGGSERSAPTRET